MTPSPRERHRAGRLGRRQGRRTCLLCEQQGQCMQAWRQPGQLEGVRALQLAGTSDRVVRHWPGSLSARGTRSHARRARCCDGRDPAAAHTSTRPASPSWLSGCTTRAGVLSVCPCLTIARFHLQLPTRALFHDPQPVPGCTARRFCWRRSDSWLRGDAPERVEDVEGAPRASRVE